MSVAQEFAEANKKYVEGFNKGDLPMAPSRKVVVVACMDSRIDVPASLGIKEGEVHIIRNAGGRASEALRSIIISQHLLGTREVVVFHHTKCGMLLFRDDDLRGKLKSPAADAIAFLPFNDLDQSVKDDVKYLQENPLLVPGIKVTGWIYEVETGKVRKVV